MQPRITLADYADPTDAAAVLHLLDEYARDPWGALAPLAQDVRERVIAGLQAQQGAFSVLAMADGAPVGLANCLAGYSTFAARPLLNIHDVYVRPAWRGRGVVALLLARVEEQARLRGCCKITLEVLAANLPAQAAYRRAGFGDPPGDGSVPVSASTRGPHLFWHKPLP